MIYAKWIFLSLINFIFMIMCYSTNWIVVLFANRDGELPSLFKNWQTWDDSTNPADVVKYKQLPKFLLYDWAEHYVDYEGTTPELAAVNRTRWFSRCYNNAWSLLERFRRYVCRVYWLTRNCGYGFAFWWFGRTVDADKLVSIVSADGKYRKTTGEGIFTIADSRPICKIFGYQIEWNNFLGWKTGINYHGPTRFMIAHRIAVKIKKEAD